MCRKIEKVKFDFGEFSASARHEIHFECMRKQLACQKEKTGKGVIDRGGALFFI